MTPPTRPSISPPDPSAPLLAATELRLDVDGVPVVERATFTCSGNSVALLGEGASVIRAVQRQARIAAGRLTILGRDVARGEPWQLKGGLGVAPLDPPLPGHMMTHAYLVAGARLAGFAKHDAERAASDTLAALHLAPLERRQLAELQRAEARAVVLAQAVVNNPLVLLAHAPMQGLSGTEAEYVTQALRAACHERRWILCIPAVVPRSSDTAWMSHADEILVFSSGHLVRQTSPSAIADGCTGYTLTVRGDLAAFRRALANRGVALEGGPARFWVDLPAHMSATDLLAVSLDTQAPIVELYPRLFGPAQW